MIIRYNIATIINRTDKNELSSEQLILFIIHSIVYKFSLYYFVKNC